MAALLAAATETALLGGHERIDATSLETAGYQPPTVRRRLFENALRVSGALVDQARDRPWPLHPQPTDWEDLQTWVRRIADVYGVSYDAFLLNALGHRGSGARDLDEAPVGVLATLSAGTGVVDRTVCAT